MKKSDDTVANELRNIAIVARWQILGMRLETDCTASEAAIV